MITSANPDPIRDYQLEERIPEILQEMAIQSEVLDDLAYQLEEYTGQKGGHALTPSVILPASCGILSMDPDTIPKRFVRISGDNLGALGAWILETNEQPLQIDFIVVCLHRLKSYQLLNLPFDKSSAMRLSL